MTDAFICCGGGEGQDLGYSKKCSRGLVGRSSLVRPPPQPPTLFLHTRWSKVHMNPAISPWTARCFILHLSHSTDNYLIGIVRGKISVSRCRTLKSLKGPISRSTTTAWPEMPTRLASRSPETLTGRTKEASHSVSFSTWQHSSMD